ncbi:M48 family metallopeptidase [Aestuariirhabdus sp. Z084]|uniref:M48 family metallopeptidase n=1 Tax=Aestuariirhabdus haliotis TaxID=2918751 RepID=UPI00201B354E|nr:M48 family metallopeptidase [Aestuariirhabdus haliotis]MCL6416524.1 M48 family metallopeptidase [Aestuariirhabdus haliotis]MCL6420514.1 M48 family metallopeptidase [Aestuariirhabdus haliotis]
MISIEGLFYDGRSSRAIPARVVCDSTGRLACHPLQGQGALIEPMDLSCVRISSRLGDTPRYAYFDSGAKFETSDNDTIDEMLKRHGRKPALGWVSSLERHWRYVFVSTIIVALFSFWMVRDGIPLTARWVAQALPPEASQMIGKGTLKLLDDQVLSESQLSPERQEALRQHFSSIIERYPELPIRLEFRHGNALGANALALPSGVIVFTDELVELAEDDNQLWAVMAHEVGHLARQHALRSVVQSSILALGLVAITGDLNAASSILVGAPTLMLELSYSREFEREADRFAVAEMKAQGIEISHFADMIVLLEGNHTHGDMQGKISKQESEEETSGWRDYLSTHPVGKDRIEGLRE